jgi:hypothetical protein
MVREEKLAGADYVVLVFLNIWYFYRRRPACEGAKTPEFYTLPIKVAKTLYRRKGKWQLLDAKRADLEKYRGERGFEQIARRFALPTRRRAPGHRRRPRSSLVRSVHSPHLVGLALGVPTASARGPAGAC